MFSCRVAVAMPRVAGVDGGGGVAKALHVAQMLDVPVLVPKKEGEEEAETERRRRSVALIE